MCCFTIVLFPTPRPPVRHCNRLSHSILWYKYRLKSREVSLSCSCIYCNNEASIIFNVFIFALYEVHFYGICALSRCKGIILSLYLQFFLKKNNKEALFLPMMWRVRTVSA